MLVHRLAGHPPHDVDAELQPQAVDFLGDGGEALAPRGGGEALYRRELAAVLV